MKILRQTTKFLIVFILILTWIFSYPPGLFPTLNFWRAKIPPEIKQAKAATLSTLRPVSPDGTITNYTDQAGGITNLWATVDDDPDSPNTTDYVKNSVSVNASVFFNLTDMPSDFSSMSTLQIDYYLNAPANWSDDTGILYGQVFKSDETTTLTSEHQLATHTTAAGYYSVTFTTVTGGNKTDWDGARLRLRVAYSKTKGPDDGQIRVAAVELDGTYTAGPDVTAPASVSMSSYQLGGVGYNEYTFASGELVAVTNSGSSGWSLTVSSTNMTGTKNTITNANILLRTDGTLATEPTIITSSDSLTGVTETTSGDYSLDSTRTIVTASAGNGIGTYNTRPTIRVNINNYGTYAETDTATLTFTVQ